MEIRPGPFLALGSFHSNMPFTSCHPCKYSPLPTLSVPARIILLPLPTALHHYRLACLIYPGGYSPKLTSP